MADFGLKSPCAQCPFRTDIKPFITAARVGEILSGEGEFHCHKTITVTDDSDDETWGDVMEDSKAQVCAGFLICLERMGQPNQMMRIAERLGLYDAGRLKMDSPVYESIDDAIDAHKKRKRR